MIIGVDIGGSKIAAGVVSVAGRVSARVQCATPVERGREAILASVGELVERLRSMHGEISAVGVGSAGQVDHVSGVVIDANENLPGFRGLALREQLQATFRVPVVVDNDVKAAALAEALAGAGQGLQQMLLIMVGTGIGGALVLGGEVYRGAASIAGEIGHIPLTLEGGPRCPCGRYGCLEAYASGRAMSERYRQLSQEEKLLNVREIAARAQEGNEQAREVIGRAGYALGRALGGLVNTLSPQALVLGGGVLQVGELFLDPLKQGLRMQALPAMLEACILRRMELEHDAVLIGAALSAAAVLHSAEGG